MKQKPEIAEEERMMHEKRKLEKKNMINPSLDLLNFIPLRDQSRSRISEKRPTNMKFR